MRVEKLTLEQGKEFLKAIAGYKLELPVKLAMTYGLSRYELLSLDWSDVGFERDTITVYPVRHLKDSEYAWSKTKEKITEHGRTYPLLPHLKSLLLAELDRQRELGILGDKICVRNRGDTLNANTLSRSIPNTVRNKGLGFITEFDGIREVGSDFLFSYSGNHELRNAWSRLDILKQGKVAYEDDYLLDFKRATNALNKFLDGTFRLKDLNSEM